MRCVQTAMLAGALIVNVVAARADDLSVDLKTSALLNATVGLNPATITFLNQYPDLVKDRTLKLLHDALPIINESVDTYLTRINDILSTQINHLECAEVGSGLILGKNFKSFITLGLLKPNPVAEIEGEQNDILYEFSPHSTPEEYTTKYADFLFNARNTACEVSLEPAALKKVEKVQNDIRWRFNAWDRVSGHCDDASTCFDWQVERGRHVIRGADQEVQIRFAGKFATASLKKPNLPGFFGTWNPENSKLP